jgi:hypothetical protein
VTGHLIHIGYAKAGSSFLRSWFALHPQLAYAEGGIAGFADVHSLVREGAAHGGEPLYRVTSSEGLATPHSEVGRAVVDHREIDRGAVPSAQAKVCRMLAALYPTAHILIVTRGFRSMILSSYSQYVRTGGSESLETLCRMAGGVAASRQAPWKYDFLIGQYRQAFGERNVIVLPYELLRDDAAAFLGEIAKRLGPADIGTLPEPANPSLSVVELAWYPRLARRIRSLPLGTWGRRKAWDLYVRAAYANQLRTSIALLQRLRPIPPATDAALTPELMDGFRGFATRLRDEPLYRGYAREYLIE